MPVNRSRRYWLELRERDQHETAKIWRILLQALREHLVTAYIDAYPDSQWPEFSRLPDSARQAQEQLARLGEQQAQAKDRLMAIRLDARDAVQFELLSKFGSYSINVEVYSSDSKHAKVALQDGGVGGWVEISQGELNALRRALRGAGLDPSDVLLPGSDEEVTRN
jgi:hypothetical protein